MMIVHDNKKKGAHQSRRAAAGLLLLGVSLPVLAMESVPDSDLSDVSGAAGVTLTINSVVRSDAGNFSINPDSGTANSATVQFYGDASNPMIASIANNGVPNGAASVTGTTAIDVDVGSSGTSPMTRVDVQGSWTRMRLQTLNQLVYSGDRNKTPPTGSALGFGAMALDGPGSFSFRQVAVGLLGMPPDMTQNQLHVTIGGPQFLPAATVLPSNPYGQFYYRQEAAGTGAELILDKLYFDAGFTPGTGGVISTCKTSAACDLLGYGGFGTGRSGIYIGTPHLDFNFTYAINMRTQPTGGAFRTDGADVKGLAYWGWTGGFNNAELLLSSGGVWTPPATGRYNPDNPQDATSPYTAATRSGGLNIGFRADFDSNFKWIVGQAGGRAIIAFGNWGKLDSSVVGLSAPNITLDVINANQGPGGLCWGGLAYGSSGSGVCTGALGGSGPSKAWGNGGLAPGGTSTNPGRFLNLPPTQTAMQLSVRDLSLQAYSRDVTIYDDMNNNGLYSDAGETKTYGWSLIYTLGQVDGNIYYYPGNSASTAGVNGVTADVLFMSQSFYPLGSNGTNVLLGNTNFMIQDSATNLGVGLVQANLLFAAKRLEILLKTGATGPSGTGGIQLSSSDMRIELQGILGGGTLPNLTKALYEKMFYVDVNIQTTNFVALLYPDVSNGYPFLGYRAKMTFGDTTAAPTNSTIGNPAATDGAYVSLAEPSNPNVDVRFSNITGDIEITGGRVFLISANDAVNAPDGVRRLQIAQTMNLGTTVSGGSRLLSDVEFGGKFLGRIGIPTGQIYSSFILKPQN